MRVSEFGDEVDFFGDVSRCSRRSCPVDEVSHITNCGCHAVRCRSWRDSAGGFRSFFYESASVTVQIDFCLVLDRAGIADCGVGEQLAVFVSRVVNRSEFSTNCRPCRFYIDGSLRFSGYAYPLVFCDGFRCPRVGVERWLRIARQVVIYSQIAACGCCRVGWMQIE